MELKRERNVKGKRVRISNGGIKSPRVSRSCGTRGI
jgi:hypothetical protein